MSKSKKILIALGISMMSTLPLTQAATNDTNHVSEVSNAASSMMFHSKDINMPNFINESKDSDYMKKYPESSSDSDKDKKMNEKNGNPPPPPSDESDSDKYKYRPDENNKPDYKPDKKPDRKPDSNIEEKYNDKVKEKNTDKVKEKDKEKRKEQIRN